MTIAIGHLGAPKSPPTLFSRETPIRFGRIGDRTLAAVAENWRHQEFAISGTYSPFDYAQRPKRDRASASTKLMSGLLVRRRFIQKCQRQLRSSAPGKPQSLIPKTPHGSKRSSRLIRFKLTSKILR